MPPFSSNTAPSSGSLGGVGWRADSLRLVILATDICSIAAFPAGAALPASITGAGTSVEPTTAVACVSTTPGNNRFGFISNAVSTAGNTVTGAVAPAGSAAVQATVTALNALGIRVLGMGPGAAPTSSPGPSSSPSVWLSALARLTGATDETGTPLVFSTSVPLAVLSTAIVEAITTAATAPVDITLASSTLPDGLTMSFTPAVVPDVPPGGTAEFTLTLTGDGRPITGSFNVLFTDFNSAAVIGSIPVEIACAAGGGCVRTPAQWYASPDDWPVSSLTIGGATYSKDDLLKLLRSASTHPKARLLRELIAARLNEATGATVPPEVAEAMDAAEGHPSNEEVPGLTETLSEYNQGLAPGGPPACS